MRTKLVGSVVLAVAVSWSAFAGGGWYKYDKNPVLGNAKLGTCFDVNVIRKGTARYNMYFSWRPRSSIALVRSDDGVTWSAPVICLRENPESGWEDNINRSCTIFWQGEYHMWYTGQARGYSRIGYAKSKDGVTFTRVTHDPVLIPERPHEGFSVMNPFVMRDEERGLFRMWYASGETYEPNVLCYAESKDGIHWEKSRINPVFVHGGGNAWDRDRVGGCEVHRLKDGRYVMFYIGYSDIHTARIGAAISPDGIRGWKRLPSNPLVEPTPGEWDSEACYKPSVVWDEEADCWRLWYNGRTKSNEYIGMVIHPGYDLEHSAPFTKVIGDDKVGGYFQRFSSEDEELYPHSIRNADATVWALSNIPRFDCPDKDIERTYYFRWWTYRKHLRKDDKGWVVTEFLPDVGWAGKNNTISCPMNHHFMEGRWLRNSDYLRDYLRFMLADGTVNGPRAYACAPAWCATEFAKVTGDASLALSLLPAFVRNYETWEKGWQLRDNFRSGYKPDRGLFDFLGDREGTEYALSPDGARPMVNAMMWAEAAAISKIAELQKDPALAKRFTEKAAALEKAIKEKLWHAEKRFFTALAPDGKHDSVCELHGYAPFYFQMPLDGFADAWKPLMKENGFSAPKGLVFPTRDTPGFTAEPDYRKHECLWNGPSWPYATSVALTALYRTLQAGTQELPISREDFAKLMHQYALQHQLKKENGKTVPWIDENLNPFTGEWQARKIMIEQDRRGIKKLQYRERGKDYNHSTFCDLVISGLCGVVPEMGDKPVTKPLAPESWDWWCLDGIRYHGKNLTILFDRDGTRYLKGKGLVVLSE
ncbi:MAG: hypothetical protein IJR99_11525 [Kiritimatiellae bacterium]|nr:hypothetical protein [Kiritimatiellia bacterium]